MKCQYCRPLEEPPYVCSHHDDKARGAPLDRDRMARESRAVAGIIVAIAIIPFSLILAAVAHACGCVP